MVEPNTTWRKKPTDENPDPTERFYVFWVSDELAAFNRIIADGKLEKSILSESKSEFLKSYEECDAD